ncbi:MAG TPA: nitronate monooxygenase family protein, partial [Dehalococcoidia bacterium]|nr:nitronate monooxygenase family protein [Dehalococcoidia bacterium]
VAAVSEAGGLGVLGAAGLGPEQIHEQCAKIRKLTSKPFGVDILLPGNTAEAPPMSAAGPSPGNGAPRSPLDMLPPQYKEWVESAIERFGLQPPPPPQPPPDRQAQAAEARDRRSRELQQVEAILEERVAVFASGLGNPAPYVQRFHDVGTKVMALVGNVKNARRVAEGGADVVVAQGYEAGGHTGRIGTFALVPQVVDAVAPTPVVAAGGVGDGRGVAAALALGAQGVWVGTAFLATYEANVLPELKQRIIEATEEDTRVTRLYSGKTMRNINNPLIEYWEESGLQALPMGMQGIVSGRVTAAARASGKPELMMNPAGQISGMLTKIRPAREVLEEMVEGAVRVLSELSSSRVIISV